MAHRTDSRPRPRTVARARIGVPILAVVVLAGCAGNATVVLRPVVDPAGTTWYGPARDDDRSALNSWAAGVGPAIVVHDASSSGGPTDSLVLVSWNTAVGDGDIAALVRDVRAAHPGAAFALLVQETFRDGPDVPTGESRPWRFAGRLGGGIRDDIETIARACGLNLYYVPSMRNGAPSATDEDRGNAILSTLPLDELTAIELPYERQRRVAVAATVAVTSPDGAAFPLRLVSAHLDNVLGPRRLWLAGALFARKRQMSAIVEHVDGRRAAVVGGDFNTWLGFAEPAFGAAFAAFPGTDTSDRRPTFLNLLRLDHLFVRLPPGWTARIERGAQRYGSDHWPLIATIRIG